MRFVNYVLKCIDFYLSSGYNVAEVKQMSQETLKNYNNLFDPTERKQLIAESLKVLRTSNGLQMKEVADLIGITSQAYGAYERGRNEPPAEVLVRLSMLYDVTIDVLVQRDNMNKDKLTVKKQLDMYDEQIKKLKADLLKGDPETQKAFGEMLDQIQKLTDTIREKVPTPKNE